MKNRRFQVAGNVPGAGAGRTRTTIPSKSKTIYNRTNTLSAAPNRAFEKAAFKNGWQTGDPNELTQELPRVGRVSSNTFILPTAEPALLTEEAHPGSQVALPARPKLNFVRDNTGPSPRQLGVGVLILVVLAFILRFSMAGLQSAYMDESSFVLTGRYLLEQHTVYAGALNWTYGSYLWSLVAGLCAMAGGLEMVRAFTTLCGVLMVLATGLFAARLLPRRSGGERRWVAAFIASLLMAVMPTGLGLGRFGTYDSLAGAACMGGIALLIPASRVSHTRNRRFELLAAALLVFVAFLSKYLDAIYFPFICLALIWAGYKGRNLREQLTWFVGPLSLACLVYFLAFSRELINLLSFSTTYADLASPQPWREYVGERPEIWLLAALALIGLWQVRRNRLVVGVCLGGTLILAAFQALARPDFDFWKHSIYPIFFLAPLAGLSLEPLAIRLARFFSSFNLRHPARRHIFVGLVLSVAGFGLLFLSLNASQKLVNFYPNLNPSLAAIQEHTAQAKTVLTNDGALRFYLYPRIITDRVTDPFYFKYQDKEGIPAYKAAVADRYFDAVVLDKGSGPQGQQLREELAGLLGQYYRQVYSNAAGNADQVMIFRPVAGAVSPLVDSELPGSKIYFFDKENLGWGGQPENGDLKPGIQVKVSQTHFYQNHPTLEFNSTAAIPLLGVKEKLEVRQLKMWVYIEPTAQNSGVVSVGMVGFDENWVWHDDGFKQTITPGAWTELTWNLSAPGKYNEIGLKFAGEPLTAYLGQVTVVS